MYVIADDLVFVLLATMSLESFIGNALFGDGAGALVLGFEPKGQERVLWEVEDTASLIIESTPNEMTWQASETGTQSMRLVCW